MKLRPYIFSKFQKSEPVEISTGNISQSEKSCFFGRKLAMSSDFRVLLVEISEVLPVEISAERSALS